MIKFPNAFQSIRLSSNSNALSEASLKTVKDLKTSKDLYKPPMNKEAMRNYLLGSSRTFSKNNDFLSSPSKYPETKSSVICKGDNNLNLPHIKMTKSMLMRQKCKSTNIRKNNENIFVSQDSHGLTLERLFNSNRDIKDMLSIVSPKLLSNGKPVFKTEIQNIKEDNTNETINEEKTAADLIKWKRDIMKNYGKKKSKDFMSPHKLKNPIEVITAYGNLVNSHLANTYKKVAKDDAVSSMEEYPKFDLLALNKRMIKEIIDEEKINYYSERSYSRQENEVNSLIDTQIKDTKELNKSEPLLKGLAPIKLNVKHTISKEGKKEEKCNAKKVEVINLKSFSLISKKHKELGKAVREAGEKHLKLADLVSQFKEEVYTKKFGKLKDKNRYELEEVLSKPIVALNECRKRKITHYVKEFLIKEQPEKVMEYIKRQYNEKTKKRTFKD